MRKFLFITPYFPPQSQVGALRPLKFVRHLPQQGWLPVVLADLWPTDGMDPELPQFVPPDVQVHYDYSHRAAPTWRALQSGELAKKRPGNTVARAKPLHERILPQWLQDPELLPLGEHSPDMPWACRAALRILRAQPDIEAIVVNADPFASFVQENPNDYAEGVYTGFGVDYVPLRGFESITVNVTVSSFAA